MAANRVEPRVTSDLIVRWGVLAVLGASTLIVIMPLLSVLFLSVDDQLGVMNHVAHKLTLHWYFALPGELDDDVWSNTIVLTMVVAALGVIGGVCCALNWWERKRIYVLLAVAFGIAAVPGAAYATSLSHCFELLGVRESSAYILVIADVLWVMPFCAVVLISGVSRTTGSQLKAAMELTGGRRVLVAWTIVGPPAIPTIVSAFTVALLLTGNEYIRSMYLGGPITLIGKTVYGRMSSGTDPTVYALSGVNVLLAVGMVLILQFTVQQVRRVGSSLT
jgi:spermidine/putrescine transport system permease protein